MAKHTPGPWRKVKCKCGFEGCNQYFVEPIRGIDGRLSEADADLIVAAPELLEALRAAIGDISILLAVVRIYDPQARGDGHISLYEKTIAKAEGRE